VKVEIVYYPPFFTMMLTMAGPLLVAALVVKSSVAFVTPKASPLFQRTRLFSSSAVSIESGISRISTLQTLLNKHGAPGSHGCSATDDLVAVKEQDLDLHPHLFAIAQSTKTGNYICGLHRCFASDYDYESSINAPWPIVESAAGARGMKLLALNSEHLMRRIASESDFEGSDGDAVSLYNEGLGQGNLNAELDAPYEEGSVEKLGYGAEKYVLLRVGPFPDLYEIMSLSHKGRGDESSSLIAAETNNGKFGGFGSTFQFYARLLQSFGARDDEARDAARMCLRLPLPSIGFLDEDFKEVAVVAQLADEADSTEEALAKMQVFYEKIKAKEQEEDLSGVDSGKTGEQAAIDDANTLLDRAALGEPKWKELRGELADIYAKAGKDDMAAFVDPSRA
jgi:hypothetical protein